MPRYYWNSLVAKVTNKFRYPDSSIKEEKVKKGTYDSEGNCKFCLLIQGEVLYKDSEVAVFMDIKRDAACHILIIPTAHIPNIDHLTPDNIPLIQKMESLGQSHLQNLCPGDHILGFHHPPRNSIDHLHMHGLTKPIFKFKSKLSYSKYLWFITPDQVISRLNNQIKI